VIFLIIAGIILAIIVFKLILPLIGNIIGIIIGAVIFFGAIALCIAFPPLFIILIVIGFFIYASNSKGEKNEC
jgi:low affinity Fe/Cu permease